MFAHQRYGGLHRLPHALQVHRHDPVEGVLGQPVGGTVPAAAYADVVAENIDAAEPGLGGGHDGLAVGQLDHVGGQGPGLAALGRDHRRCLLGPGQVPIDAEDVGAFAGEQDRHGAAVADGLAGGLPSPDHHGGLALKTAGHDQNAFRSGSRVWPASSCTPKLFRIIDTCVYWPQVNTTSMHCLSVK